MPAQLLDGRITSRAVVAEVEAGVADFKAKHGWAPGIAVIQVGSDPAAGSYVRQIRRAFSEVGMRFDLHSLEADVSAAAFADLLRALNANPQTNGIIIQMPLPGHLSASLLIDTLDPAKDVDGIHPLNAGRLMQGNPEALVPATPAGGMELLRRYGIELSGKRAVVVGRSNIVGRPMAMLLLHQHATVTICHSRTHDLGAVTREGDILAVAVGKAKMITAEMIKPGAVVVDFGVNVVDGKMVGDVDTEGAMEVASYVSPVPGGTGPMTNAMLMANTLAAARRQVGD